MWLSVLFPLNQAANMTTKIYYATLRGLNALTRLERRLMTLNILYRSIDHLKPPPCLLT